jgi:hypothetical protein
MTSERASIPTPIRETLDRMEAYWTAQDTERSTALRVVLRDQELEHVATRAVIARLLVRRMRERVEALKIQHPELSMRKVFNYVSQFTGYEASSVWKIYYPKRAKVVKP